MKSKQSALKPVAMTTGKTWLLAATSLLSLGGCAILDHKVAADQSIKTVQAVDDQFAAASQNPVATRIAETSGVWVNKRSLSVREERLPAAFHSKMLISFAARSSLKDIVSIVSRESGVRFSFAADVQQASELPVLSGGFTSDGDLRSLLDRLAAQTDMSWRYRDSAVEFYRFETKVFQVAALPGSTQFVSTVSSHNASGTSGSTSSSGQDAKYDVKLDFWSSIKDDVKGLAKNGSYSVSETNGTVTVTGTPQILSSVDSYIRNLNAMRMRQVALDVRAYTVDVDNSRNFGLSWDLAMANLGAGVGVKAVTTASQVISNALTAIADPASAGKWANSSAVLNALSAVGRTALAAESSQMVLSGESLSLNSLTQENYIAQVKVTPSLVAGGEPAVDSIPATISTGFAMTLTPSIINGDYVQISGVIDLSSLIKFDEQGTGSQKIKLPKIATQAIPLRIGLRSGETYVFGMRQKNVKASDSGAAGPSIGATVFGGQHGSSESHNTIIVTVTPYIINPKN